MGYRGAIQTGKKKLQFFLTVLNLCHPCTASHLKRTHTKTHPFNGPLYGTTRVSWYQKGKTNLDLTTSYLKRKRQKINKRINR